MHPINVHVLAKALYDNNAEAPDELAFRKGDVVTVLEQNTSGLEGWWLCSLNGRQGIAPGNRLKLLVGMYDSSPNVHGGNSPQKVASPTGPGPDFMYDSPTPSSPRRSTFSTPGVSIPDYDIPRPSPHARLSSPEVSTRGYQTMPARKPPTLMPKLHKQTSVDEVYDVPPKQYAAEFQETYDVPTTTHWTSPAKSVSPTQSVERRSPVSSELYDTPTKRNSEVMMAEVYDIPPSTHGVALPIKKSALPMQKSASLEKDLMDDYDIPLPSTESQLPTDLYDVPPSQHRQSPTEVYDVPPPLKAPNDLYDSPRRATVDGPRIPEGAIPDLPRRAEISSEDYGSPGYCKMKSFPRDNANTKDFDHVYDIPPQVTKDKPLSGSTATLTKHASVDEVDSKMENLSVDSEQRSKSFDSGTLGRHVLLGRDTAMDLMVKRQQVLETAIAYLLSYVSSQWRQQDHLAQRIHEIKAACNQLKLALKEFLDFAKDTVIYAAKSSDVSLQTELGMSLQPLQAAHVKILRSSHALDNLDWSVDKLKHSPAASSSPPSDLDQFAFVAKILPSDMKTFINFVTTHSQTLFRPSADARSHTLGPQHRPLPTPPGGVSISNEKNFTWTVAEKESRSGKSSPARAPSPQVQSRPLPNVPCQIPLPASDDGSFHSPSGNTSPSSESEKCVDYGYITKTSMITSQIIVDDETNHNISYSADLTSNDKEIIKFYQQEVQAISEDTISAVDKFFTCVEAKQPPKVFVAHSKHIILLGHKLVFIGDTLHHNLSHTQFRSRVIHMSDLLCDCLNVGVNATKTAALQYPAVQPVQEMVDRITDIANATQDLKLAILEVAINEG